MANVVEPQIPGQQTQPQGSGAGKGCLWGCLLLLGLGVASILCVGIGGYWFANRLVSQYTSDTPVDLPTVEYTEDELATLEARIESFRSKLNAGETPEEDLVLTADDINALIGKNEDFKGKVFVKIENNQVEGDVSIPLDKVPLCEGRYFNGKASFNVSMEGGVLIVTADQAEFNGNPVPEEFMQSMRNENLAKDVYKDEKNAKFMRQFEDIKIEDNKFILRVKRNDDSGVQENPLIESGEDAAGTSDADATEPAANTEAAPDDETAGSVQ
ncbi:MAG: hypothetical protein KDB00_10675 [Planctomycetales bacterium]|nr:hypothetical protein [Planctomycetales bacterium]